MMKIRPFSAGHRKPRQLTTNPMSSIKRDTILLQSSNETGKFLDTHIFKLTEASFIDHKSLASTQISQELKTLKNSSNKTQLSKTTNNWIIEKLSLELDQIKSTEHYSRKLPGLAEKIKELKEHIAETKHQQEERLKDREIYLQIEKRMIETKIHLDLKKHELRDQLKQKEILLKSEQEKKIKSRESRCRSARVYRNFDKTSHFFNKSKVVLAKKFDNEKKASEEMDRMREEHDRRHAEICENVDNEENIRKFKGIREKVMLLKLWHMSLSNKLSKYVTKFGTIDLAFRKIRGITGLSDITEVVEKFLTKENLYTDLMLMANQNKTNKEQLINKIKNLEGKIEELNICERPAYVEVDIKELYDSIYSVKMKNEYEKERLKKIMALMTKVESWLKKIIWKIKKDKNLDGFRFPDLVVVLKNTVYSELSSLKLKPDQKVLNELNKKKLSEFSKLSSSPEIKKIIQKEKIMNEEIIPCELDYVDEVFENRKRSFFKPIIEKVLKNK